MSGLESYVLPDGKALAIRTCSKDMTSHGGFQWPESGPVECPDWSPQASCCNGLHGLLDGIGNFGLLSNDADAKWLLVEVDRADVVQIDDQKCKFPRGNVIYCGDMATAMTYIGKHYIRLMIEGNKEEATEQSSGHYSKLAASGDSSNLAASGDSSKLAASGHSSNLAASGDSSKLAASGGSSKLAASGDSSNLAASGDYSKLAASGYYSNLAASGPRSLVVGAACDCTASAGEDGCIALAWWDTTNKRYRLEVGYVGENGIEPNTVYRLDSDHKFSKV